jgi:hypothetical protein
LQNATKLSNKIVNIGDRVTLSGKLEYKLPENSSKQQKFEPAFLLQLHSPITSMDSTVKNKFQDITTIHLILNPSQQNLWVSYVGKTITATFTLHRTATANSYTNATGDNVTID